MDVLFLMDALYFLELLEACIFKSEKKNCYYLSTIAHYIPSFPWTYKSPEKRNIFPNKGKDREQEEDKRGERDGGGGKTEVG